LQAKTGNPTISKEPKQTPKLIWEVLRAATAALTFFPPFKYSPDKLTKPTFYVDGALRANNPTRATITEIFQCIREEKESCENKHTCNIENEEKGAQKELNSKWIPRSFIELVVSIGCSQQVPEKIESSDNEKLSQMGNPHDVLKYISSLTALPRLANLLVESTIETDGEEVDSVREWCLSIGAHYSRINPMVSNCVEINETDSLKIVEMLSEAERYLHLQENEIDHMCKILLQE